MSSTTIAVVNVISMLPDVHRKQRFQAFGDGISGIGFLGDNEFAIFVRSKPDPTRTEERGSFLFELRFEGFERTKIAVNSVEDCTFRRVVVGCDRRELEEVQVVVQDLSGIVEDSALRFGDNLLQRHRLELRSNNEFIEVIDVGLQMLTVVILNRFLTDYRL